VISHGAADHAGGAGDLLAALPVGRVLLPEPDRASPWLASIARDATPRSGESL
jgi:glyoxylase-like metal-dependent hydrolase (beta-lactamase superfamily II)